MARAASIRVLVVVCVLVAGAARAGAGQLEWDRKEVELHPGPGETKAEAVFHFKHTGTAAVTIRQVRSSCGCTAAQPDKTRYVPGEEGEIKAVFTFGSRAGRQVKDIEVITDDGSEPRTVLRMVTYIARAITLVPPALSWEEGEALAAKTAKAEIAEAANIRVLDARSTSDAVDVEVRPSGKDFEIVVTPKRNDVPIRAAITLRGDWPKHAPSTATLHVGVR